MLAQENNPLRTCKCDS